MFTRSNLQKIYGFIWFSLGNLKHFTPIVDKKARGNSRNFLPLVNGGEKLSLNTNFETESYMCNLLGFFMCPVVFCVLSLLFLDRN